MSIKRCFTGILTLCTALLVVAPCGAQHEIHHIPPLINADGQNPDVAHPFIDPMTFNPDFQFFAPADFSTFGDGPDANTGFFATYDRVYLWITRPEDQFAVGPYQNTTLPILEDDKGGDFGTGNRFDLGYMTDEDHGWLGSIWHMPGPAYFDRFTIERVDVYDAADEVNGNPESTQDLRSGGGAGGADAGLLGQPRRDANNAITGARDFIIENSVNVMNWTSWEMNKTFRVRSLHYGSVIEPFFGVRYMKIQDWYRRGTYQRYDNTTGAPLGPGIPIPPTDITNFTIEDLNRIDANYDNHLVGGQLGLRWFKEKGRWDLSGELRVFAFQNFQSFHYKNQLERTYFQNLGVDAQIDTVILNKNQTAGHAAEFVYGSEIRAEAAFAVSRDISLRCGMAFMEFGRGIGRGDTLANNDQDLTMIGGTFGFTVNR